MFLLQTKQKNVVIVNKFITLSSLLNRGRLQRLDFSGLMKSSLFLVCPTFLQKPLTDQLYNISMGHFFPLSLMKSVQSGNFSVHMSTYCRGPQATPVSSGPLPHMQPTIITQQENLLVFFRKLSGFVLAFLDVNSISFLQLLWGIFYFQDIFLRFF